MLSPLRLKRSLKMHRKKNLEKTFNLRGKLIRVVSVSGLADIIGKSRNTILRYERTEVFPQAPFRKGTCRYYPVTLAIRLAPLVKQLPLHKKPEPELLTEINKLFKEETQKCL